MGSTKIEWAEKVWNPVAGCTPVSEGCSNCYAAKWARRLAAMGKARYQGLTTSKGVYNGEVRCVSEVLEAPLKWRKPSTIFVCSMSDLYHEKVPFEFLDRVKAVEALCPQHTFIELTKRPQRMAEYHDAERVFSFGNHYGAWVDVAHEILGVPEGQVDSTIGRRIRAAMDKGLRDAGTKCGTCLPNVWLGTSVENEGALHRVEQLLKCPTAVRALSLEPLLGAIDLRKHLHHEMCPEHPSEGTKMASFGCMGCRDRIQWVIVGGESGPKARYCDPEWIRSIIKQCKAAGVPVYVKQFGEAWAKKRKLRGKGQSKGQDPESWPKWARVRQWAGGRDQGIKGARDQGSEGSRVKSRPLFTVGLPYG